jgi:hypothetical protein
MQPVNKVVVTRPINKGVNNFFMGI